MQETPVQFLGQEDPLEKGIGYPLLYTWASLVAQLVKNPPTIPETWIQSLGWEGSPGEGKGYQLQYSGLENGVSKRWTQLSDFPFTSSITDYNLSSTTICFLSVLSHTFACLNQL